MSASLVQCRLCICYAHSSTCTCTCVQFSHSLPPLPCPSLPPFLPPSLSPTLSLSPLSPALSLSLRHKTEALLRYHLYIDCMPPEGMQEIGRDWLERIGRVARSMPRLQEPRCVHTLVDIHMYVHVPYEFLCGGMSS